MPIRPDRLREMRESRGLKQSALVDLCEINMYQISRYENGKSDPLADYLELMVRHLNVSADYLIGLSDFPHATFGEPLTSEQSQLLHAYEYGDMATVLEMVSARMRQTAKE